ncbi:MAG: TonB-dependent receptor, partial [Alphaproteobacteria bacterium]|nr:TonB-dependent receptor [Alphaproteobacteria bacterium]
VYGFTTWPSVPVEIEEIRQIEVVKGPNTALYGFNAFGGVINIVTYNPIYDRRSGASATVGGDPSLGGSASVVTREGKIGVRASAGFDRSDGFDDPLPSRVSSLDQDPEATRAAFAVVGELAPAVHLEAEATGSNLERTEVTGAQTWALGSYDQRSVRTALNADHATLGFWKLQAYHNKTDADLQIEVDGQGQIVPLAIDSDLTVASLEGLFKPVAQHNARLLMEYRDTRTKFASGPLPAGSGGADIYSLGGTWHWQTTDWLTLTAAGRLDHFDMFLNGAPRGFDESDYDRTFTEPSYNLGSVAKVGAADTVRLAAGSGVLLPNHVDIFYNLHVAPNPFSITGASGDPRIDPAKNVNVGLGWNHVFESFGANLDASVFWQRQSDLKSVSGRPSSPTLVVVGSEVLTVPRNVGDSTVVGAELALEGELADSWRYRLGYTLLSVDDDLEVNQTAAAYPVDFEDSTPTHTVDLGLGYVADPFSADLAVRWQSERTLFAPNDTPTFELGTVDVDHVFDVSGRLGYQLSDNIDLSQVGTNIFGGTDWGPGVDIDSRVLLSLRWVLDH